MLNEINNATTLEELLALEAQLVDEEVALEAEEAKDAEKEEEAPETKDEKAEDKGEEATTEADDAEAAEIEETPETELEELNIDDLPGEGGESADDEEEEVEVDEDSEVEEATFAALFLEQFATPEEISAMAESYDEMGAMSETMGVAMEKVIVRLDKKSRLAHLQQAAVFKLANAANDPKYRKLLTLWKMERQIEAYLNKKYASQATKIAKSKIKNYTAQGLKKVSGDPKKEVGKGKIANKVAARAVEQTKKSFSNK